LHTPIVLTNPAPQAARGAVERGLSEQRCIIAVGECGVEYSGRSRSTLSLGERIIIVKSDGTILVHRPAGYEPVNWQPPECRFRTDVSDGCLVLVALRRRPTESLKVTFRRIKVLVVAGLSDVGEFSQHVTEQEMRNAILLEPRLLLPDFRPISYEKRVNPGFIDLYGLDSAGRLVVVELKRVKAGRSAVLQLSKYVDYLRTEGGCEVRGVLAAPGIAKGVQRLLETLRLEFVAVDLERCARAIYFGRRARITDFLEQGRG
jgi:RecB family endonuclease NucS